MLSTQELERLADHLLREDFSDTSKNKVRTAEFPVLSPYQIKRRAMREIPYSSLSERQRIECAHKHMDYYPREVD